MIIRIHAIVAFLLGTVLFACAGSLTISPVRVDLTEKKPNALIQVVNAGEDPITVQVHAANWRNDGADDFYGDTNDVVVNPPVFILAPGEKQVLRLGLRRRESADIERSYRLIFEEVPKPPKPGTIGTVLRITVPVFQVPRRPVAPKLVWQASFTRDGELKLVARNEGSAHDLIRNVVLEIGANHIEPSISAYILPGGQREFKIRDHRLENVDCVGLSVMTDSGKVHEEFVLQRN